MSNKVNSSFTYCPYITEGKEEGAVARPCSPAWSQSTAARPCSPAWSQSTAARPCSPGWSLWKKDDPDYYVNAISAGIDCLGLAMRAAGYDGNPYRKWAELHEYLPNDPSTWHIGNRRMPAENRNIDIYKATLASHTTGNAVIATNLSAVVPGDMFYIRFSDNGTPAIFTDDSDHIAIVRSVTFTKDTNGNDVRVLGADNLANIQLIEAQWELVALNPVWGKVIKGRYTPNSYNGVGHKYWHIIRLDDR